MEPNIPTLSYGPACVPRMGSSSSENSVSLAKPEKPELPSASGQPVDLEKGKTTTSRNTRWSRDLFSTITVDLQAAFFEFVGTLLFLTLAFGCVQSVADQKNIYTFPGDISMVTSVVPKFTYISLAFGLSLVISIWIFAKVTGGVLNPNVSLALLLVGELRPVRFVLYCIAQMTGGIVAAAFISAVTPGPIGFNTTLAAGVTPGMGVAIEMVVTAALVLVVLMLAVERHSASPVAPLAIGLTLLVGHLFSAHLTGASISTARAFGPAVVSGFKDTPHHWVYWIGPTLGSVLGSGVYGVLKLAKFWQVEAGTA